MSPRDNTLFNSLNDPFSALQGEQRRDLQDNPPKSGQKINILGAEYFVVSRGTEKGTNTYVIGEVMDENPLPSYSGNVLREAEVPENYVAHTLNGEIQNFSVEFAEFDEEEENVVSYGGERYFKLDGEL